MDGSSIDRLLTRWAVARAELRQIERDEHPDVVDRHGRVWTWKSGDLYTHCGSAAPGDMINQFGLPSQSVLDNQNYDLCGVCVAGRERNVTPCKPEWNCSHVVCARLR